MTTLLFRKNRHLHSDCHSPGAAGTSLIKYSLGCEVVYHH